MKSTATRILLIVAVFVTALPAMAQTKPPVYTGDSPRVFVEGFYKWYVKRTLNAENDTSADRWDTTRKLARPSLSPQLAKLLDEDAAAQAKCDDIVGLDFDPFLNGQDIADHYVVGAVVPGNNAYRAEIYSVIDGKRSKKPDVIAEFVRKDGHWYFINFHYPEGGDLLKDLKSRPACTAPRSSTRKK